MTIVVTGVVVPEALAAADELAVEGIAADVVVLTSPDLVFRALQARQGLTDAAGSEVRVSFTPAAGARTAYPATDTVAVFRFLSFTVGGNISN